MPGGRIICILFGRREYSMSSMMQEAFDLIAPSRHPLVRSSRLEDAESMESRRIIFTITAATEPEDLRLPCTASDLASTLSCPSESYEAF
jgi:hypothetical protein